ncbi:hypothetical protein [Streptomyces sp. NPDC002889]
MAETEAALALGDMALCSRLSGEPAPYEGTWAVIAGAVAVRGPGRAGSAT